MAKVVKGEDIKSKRLNTALESEAAEFLVLGRLLLEKIPAFKAYVNYPGYDLIATDAERNASARIQVKSRYRTDWDGFIINSFDCDFVIFVALNRGFKKTKKNGDRGVKDPEYFVLPITWVKKVRDLDNKWGKITFHDGVTALFASIFSEHFHVRPYSVDQFEELKGWDASHCFSVSNHGRTTIIPSPAAQTIPDNPRIARQH